MKRLLTVLAVVLAVSVTASATVINAPWIYDPINKPNQELNLFQVYNHHYYGDYTGGSGGYLDNVSFMADQVSPDELFFIVGPDDGFLTAHAVYAGWSQTYGVYDPDDPTNRLGPVAVTQNAGRFGLNGFNVTSPGLTVPVGTFQPSGLFGVYNDPSGGPIVYSQAALNNLGLDHMVTFWSPLLYDAVKDEWYRELFLGFEDNGRIDGKPDWDYNDLVLTLRGANIVPEPASIMLMGLGIAGLAVRRMRARKSA